MNKMIKNVVIVFACLISTFAIFSLKKSDTAFADNGSAEIVMELNSKRVLYAKNETVRKFMASTTKILTAITVIENCDVNSLVTVTKETVGVEGSSIYLEAGEVLTVKDLLFGLMLRSGNDCAETLAVYCSGSIENFACLMNETARKIGAVNSHFVNPHGLHNDGHFTTAYDLALISCYAMKNDIFREIVSTKTVEIPFSTRNYNRRLVNKNKMLKEFEGSTGIKTGFTKKAGRCLVSSCRRNGMELISVVLNCPPMFERSKELLADCFNEYSYEKILEADDIIDFVEIKDSDKKCAIYVKNDIYLPLTKMEKKNFSVVYDYPDKLVPPLEKDETVGNIKIYYENNLLFSEKVYNIVEVN